MGTIFTMKFETAEGMFYLEHHYDESGCLVKTVLRKWTGEVISESTVE